MVLNCVIRPYHNPMEKRKLFSQNFTEMFLGRNKTARIRTLTFTLRLLFKVSDEFLAQYRNGSRIFSRGQTFKKFLNITIGLFFSQITIKLYFDQICCAAGKNVNKNRPKRHSLAFWGSLTKIVFF